MPNTRALRLKFEWLQVKQKRATEVSQAPPSSNPLEGAFAASILCCSALSMVVLNVVFRGHLFSIEQNARRP